MRTTIAIVLALSLIIFSQSASLGQDSDAPEMQKLLIGTKDAPPFAIKSLDGTWKGISIDLWRQIASELNLSYEFEETDLKGLLGGVEEGSLDAAVSALTITAKREQSVDFTHPFHTSGLGIAVVPKKGRIWGVVERFISLQFLRIIAFLSLLLFTIGIIVWFFEHRRNPEQFGGKTLSGIGSAFWWSAVTMTTVGYGDKAPKTLGGRIVSIVWMFTGIILISSFTAAITSTLTVSQLESGIKGPEDLPKVKVGTIPDSTSQSYLLKRDIRHREYATPLDGLNALRRGEIEAMVYDAPILRYLANSEFPGQITVLHRIFERQDYGIALHPGSPLREQINGVLLEKITAPEWSDTLYRYLGE